jgi:hypothetical protein
MPHSKSTFTWYKSKTFWGAVALAAGVVLGAEKITAQVVVEAIGILLGGLGLRHAIAKGGGGVVGAVLAGALLIAGPASAVELHPHAALTVDRPSGPDRWSTGFLFGCEVATEPVWIAANYQLHDILTDNETYEWDATFEVAAGVSTAYEFMGVTSAPYGALTLSRPTGPATWSVGVRFGLEVDFDPLYVDAAYQLHDVWSAEDVYPWNGTLRFAAGTYF